MAIFVKGFSRAVRQPNGGYTVGPAWNVPAPLRMPGIDSAANRPTSRVVWSGGQTIGRAPERPTRSPVKCSEPDRSTAAPIARSGGIGPLGGTTDPAVQAYYDWAEAIRTGPIDHRHTRAVPTADALWIYAPWFAGEFSPPAALIPPSGKLRAASFVTVGLYCLERIAIDPPTLQNQYQERRERRQHAAFVAAMCDATVAPSLAEHVASFQRAVATAKAALPPGTLNRAPSEAEMRSAFGAIHYFLRPDEKAYIGTLAEHERLIAAYELLKYKIHLWISVLHEGLPVYEAARTLASPIEERRAFGAADEEHMHETIEAWVRTCPEPESDWQIPPGGDAIFTLSGEYMGLLAHFEEASSALVTAVFRNIRTTEYVESFRRLLNDGLRGQIPRDGRERTEFIRRQLQRFMAATLVRDGLHHLIYSARTLPFESAMTLPQSALEIFDSHFSDIELAKLIQRLARDPAGARAQVKVCFEDIAGNGALREEPPQ